MNATQRYHHFWSSFDWIAYDETSVPDHAELPYITYQYVRDAFDRPVPATASLWVRSSSWQEITEKEMEIYDYITRGGISLSCDGGCIWIARGTPWAQRMGDASDRDIRRIVLNVEVEFQLVR